MRILKKIGAFLLDFLDVYLPTVCLLATFLSFLVNAFSRYIFRSPINYCYEICLLGLLWCLLLSASNATRHHKHVSFTMIYDRLNPVGQMILRFISNGIILYSMAVVFLPSWEWVDFMGIRRTASLHLRLNIVYFPVLIFIAMTFLYVAVDFIRDCILVIKMVRHESIPLPDDKKEGN